MKFEWEDIKNLTGVDTYRAKVFGGWIVNNVSCAKDSSGKVIALSESSVFVPDPLYQWVVE